MRKLSHFVSNYIITGGNIRKRSLRRTEKIPVIQALKIPKKSFWRIPGRIDQVGPNDTLFFSLFEYLLLQFTLEQHGFELRGSTYISIFSKNTVNIFSSMIFFFLCLLSTLLHVSLIDFDSEQIKH